MDFRKIFARLLELLQANPPHQDPIRATAVRETATAVMAEAAVDAVTTLYDILVQHEQFREAAALLAYSLPNFIVGDRDIQARLALCYEMAQRMRDPEVEKLAFAAELSSSVPDAFAANASGLPPRAWYFLQAVRLRQSTRAVEFGCGGGGNIFQLATMEPSVEWVGVDVSPTQIEACKAQALRLGLKNVWFQNAGAHPGVTPPAPGDLGDVVAVLDTIEHTVFPQELLAEAEKWVRVKPGHFEAEEWHGNGWHTAGIVVVSCPNGGWSAHTKNEDNLAPGQHVATRRMGTMALELSQRGKLLDLQILPGFSREGNSTLVAAYAPGEAAAAGSTFLPRMRLRGESTDHSQEMGTLEPMPVPAIAVLPGETLAIPLAGKTVAIAYLQPSYWGSGHPPNLLDDPDATATMAGGETYALECAFGLAAAGARVDFYSHLFAPGTYKGVEFRPALAFLARPPDVLMSLMDPYPFQFAPPGCKTILLQQVNHMDFPAAGDWKCDLVVAASENHMEHLQKMHGASHALGWAWAHNGCHLEKYTGGLPLAMREPIVAYWSSPDRGLHHLLRAWPLVRKANPNARLRVYYEIDRLIQTTKDRGARGERFAPGMVDVDRRMDELISAVSWSKLDETVEFRGMLPKARMIKEQMEARVMAYPCDPIFYTEGFGASIVEGLAAGCVVLTNPVDAFPSLYHNQAVRWIGRTVAVPPSDPTYIQMLADEILKSLQETAWPPLGKGPAEYSWTESRKQFVALVKDTLGL